MFGRLQVHDESKMGRMTSAKSSFGRLGILNGPAVVAASVREPPKSNPIPEKLARQADKMARRAKEPQMARASDFEKAPR
jgi:hypothetical protein